MNRDAIGQALRFVAMGRTNHPLVEELADALCALLNNQPVLPDVLTVEIAEPKRRVKKAE